MSELLQFVIDDNNNDEFYDSEVCERKGGFLYSICGCNKTDAVRIAEALNSYAPLLAENSALRDALAAKVADNQRLKSLAVAGADLAIDIATTGIEASKRSDELELQNAELVAQVATLQQSVLKCSELVNADGGTAIDWLIDNCDDLREQAKATPQQCLREIQAEAVLNAVRFFHPSRDIDVEALKSYANRIKEGKV